MRINNKLLLFFLGFFLYFSASSQNYNITFQVDMSTVDSTFNSLATLWSVDIYSTYLNPKANDNQKDFFKVIDQMFIFQIKYMQIMQR